MARFVIYKDKKDVPRKQYSDHTLKWRKIAYISIGFNVAFLVYKVLTTIVYG